MNRLLYKRYINAFCAALSIGVLMGSCVKRLDQNTQTLITDPIFWKDSTDLISATNYLYVSLPDFGSATEELYSDFALDIRTTTINTISDGSRVIPANDGRWNSAYTYIRAANNILEIWCYC